MSAIAAPVTLVRSPGTHPHADYIAAVAAACNPAGQGPPLRLIHGEYDGLLRASLILPDPYPAGAAPVPEPPVNGGSGEASLCGEVRLLWDQRSGWRAAVGPPSADAVAELVSLPVPVLAAPHTVAALLPALRAGRTTDLPGSAQRWRRAEQYAAALGRLDVTEALEAQGWARISGPDQPVALRAGSVTWSLTHDVNPIWRWGDWRASHLRGPGWHLDLPAQTPAEAVLALCRAAAGPRPPAWPTHQHLPSGA